jgi:PAS domain S-box-containing protein
MQHDMSSLVFLQYLTTVFDSIEDGIILIGVEPEDRYRLLMANQPFYNTSGHTEKDIGKTVDNIISEPSYKSMRDYYRKVVATKETVEHVSSHDLPAGRITYHIKLIPILNAVGETIHIAGIIHDITELEQLRAKVKQNTRALMSLNEDLQTD